MGNQSESRTPGPNDYKLQAVLEFDYDVINKLKENYKYLSTTISELHKDQFRFKWLDKKNLKKLNNKNNLFYYQPYFFKKGSFRHGGYVIIDDYTVLLSLVTM